MERIVHKKHTDNANWLSGNTSSWTKVSVSHAKNICKSQNTLMPVFFCFWPRSMIISSHVLHRAPIMTIAGHRQNSSDCPIRNTLYRGKTGVRTFFMKPNLRQNQHLCKHYFIESWFKTINNSCVGHRKPDLRLKSTPV